jgi:hypothetical protein
MTYLLNQKKDGQTFWLGGYEPKHNYISPAGGSRDPEEDVLQTARRELYEETCSQMYFKQDVFQKKCFGILRKQEKGRIGYIFLVLVHDWDDQSLNQKLQRAYRQETRPHYKEIDRIVSVRWDSLMHQKSLKRVKDTLTQRSYPL